MATLQDIATRVGVSQPVVSKVLNGGTVVGCNASPATRTRILAAARELGYRRDLAAAATRSRRFGSIALVLSTANAYRSSLPSEMIAAITDALEQAEMHLSLARLSDAALTDERQVPRLLRYLGADGLLVNYNRCVPTGMDALIKDCRIPAIWLNDKRPHDAVYPDDFDAGRWATQMLIERGHRRIVYLSHTLIEQPTHYSETDRLAGYEQAMADVGLASQAITTLTSPQRMAWLMEHLAGGDRPSGFVCYSSKQASEVLHAAAKLGLDCPRDFALITFGGAPMEHVGLHLTGMCVPNEEVGRRGVRMLIQAIEHPGQRLAAQGIAFQADEGRTI